MSSVIDSNHFEIEQSQAVGREELIAFTLHLADNTLILAQRNAAWCGHGPILEQDIALTNISLDLLGQARSFFQYAAELINAHPGIQSKYGGSSETISVTEDTLAYLRTERDYKNCLLTEQQNGDWAKTILRQFFFSCYQFYFYSELQASNDGQLAALAVKSLKEVTYHLRWSSEWVIRLGDGTNESHTRISAALNELWDYTGELFKPAPYEQALITAGISVDLSKIHEPWKKRLNEVLSEATLDIPSKSFVHTGGKIGVHTEQIGYILAEMQYLQRAYPGVDW